jgi:hypothetical protein
MDEGFPLRFQHFNWRFFSMLIQEPKKLIQG